jgi:plastocyanin
MVVVVEVAIWDFFFEPALPSVAPGTTVVWVNRGAHPHTVSAFDGSFDSGVLMPGEAFAITFGGSGTVWYFCEIHPSMTGGVTVGDGGGAAGFAFARAGGTTARAGVH